MAAEILGDEEFRVVLGAAGDGEAWAFERLHHLGAQPVLRSFRGTPPGQDRIRAGHGELPPRQQQVATK